MVRHERRRRITYLCVTGVLLLPEAATGSEFAAELEQVGKRLEAGLLADAQDPGFAVVQQVIGNRGNRGGRLFPV